MVEGFVLRSPRWPGARRAAGAAAMPHTDSTLGETEILLDRAAASSSTIPRPVALAPFSGATINVDTDGVRLTGPHDASPRHSGRVFSLFHVGFGSPTRRPSPRSSRRDTRRRGVDRAVNTRGFVAAVRAWEADTERSARRGGPRSRVSERSRVSRLSSSPARDREWDFALAKPWRTTETRGRQLRFLRGANTADPLASRRGHPLKGPGDGPALRSGRLYRDPHDTSPDGRRCALARGYGSATRSFWQPLRGERAASQTARRRKGSAGSRLSYDCPDPPRARIR